jgi:photosystem II stability/assembly factor-like uncharacterized protein
MISSFYSFSQVSLEGSKDYGRIFDITYHPSIQNKLYAHTLGSHILTSNDNGINWEVLYSNPSSNLYIENLKFVQSNMLSFNLRNGYHDNHLVMLNLDTNQVEKQFVLPIPTNSQGEWITAYDIFEQNTDVAIVSQGYRIGFASFYKVYYTKDAGINWNEIYTSITNNYVAPNNVAISPDNSQKLFIAKGLGPEGIIGGLLISTNAGQNWTEQLSGVTLAPLAFHPQDSNIILAGTAATIVPTITENLYQSLDGGSTWQIIPINWSDFVQNSILKISYNPNNPNNIIVLEEDQVIITNDNFQTHVNNTFTEDVDGYHYGLNISFNPFSQNEIYVSANYHPLFSVDGGNSFIKRENPFFTCTNISTFQSNNEVKHLYYGVQYGYAHRDLLTQSENSYNILPLNYVTTNESLFPFTDPNLNGRTYNFLSGFSGSNLQISNNHGTDYTNIPIDFQFMFAVASQVANQKNIWASFSQGDVNGSDGSVVYEIDFSDVNNISQVLIQLPEFGIVSSIYINPNDSNSKIIALDSKIYKTIDNGITWIESSTGLESLNTIYDRIFKIVNNPLDNNQFTLATTRGIFTSYDSGNNWQLINNALIENVKHSQLNNGVIVATSYSRDYSIFSLQYSSNMGQSWSEVSIDNLFNPLVSSADFVYTSDAIETYLATADLGLIKYTIEYSSLDIPELEKSSNLISLFPSPAQDILNIQTQEVIKDISVYSVLGKKVAVSIISKNSVDVSNLAQGIYLVKITTEEEKTFSSKFIIK